MPVTIGPIRDLAAQSRQPKSSLVDRPGVLVPPLFRRRSSASGQQVSASVIKRQMMYAERDASRSVDPGMSLGVEPIEEDEEEDLDVAAAESSLAGAAGDATGLDPPIERSRKQAMLILQKTRENNAPGSMWASLAG